jgi:hypothetical protein
MNELKRPWNKTYLGFLDVRLRVRVERKAETPSIWFRRNESAERSSSIPERFHPELLPESKRVSGLDDSEGSEGSERKIAEFRFQNSEIRY